ncbi:MAG: hypothetical protein ACKOE5_12990 [Cytophagales bacterium]
MRTAFKLMFAILLLAFACDKKQSTVSKLQGHWHIVSNDHYNSTLDISDSTVVFDKYTLVSYSEEFGFFDSTSQSPVLPFYCGCGSAILPVFSKFKLRQDSLIYDDDELAECYAFGPLLFIRSDPKKCFQQHTFSGGFWHVKLDKFQPASGDLISYDSSIRNHQPCHVGIGYPKFLEDGVEPKVQAHDVFIEKNEIPKLLNEIKSLGQPIALYFIIDSSVPSAYIHSVMAEFKKEKDKIQAVYQLVEANGQLGYQLMDF